MSVLTRKQREIRQREQQILVVARQMLLERGYLGLNMDRIAEAIGYSKGTVYQHFSSKEDLLAALCVQTKQKRVEFFEKAARFTGKPRERMTAISLAHELFISQFPDYSRSDELLNIESIFAKASECQQDAMREVEGRCVDTVCGIAQDAVTCGDLVMPANWNIYDMIYGLYGMSYGCRAAIKNCTALHELMSPDDRAALRRNQEALLDGWGWRPLSSDWDYEATRKRAAAEAFGVSELATVSSGT
ncbi:MAG: TetR/AcrR family transcriptional regulator [Phycisphaerales bacterium]|nr:TetR/AcrR family transcriptional regulator [Phycisphaerales bacterium]MCB9862186.1 TetR/AcrR family transcriptional regulator [Phycisphaerales bacterium]